MSPTSPPDDNSRAQPDVSTQGGDYWNSSIKIVAFILSSWAFISLGCGILFREWLDATLPNVGGAPFGFWMAQQGSIIGFLILLFLYMILMSRLDKKFGYGEEE